MSIEPTPRKRRILIVDDASLVRMYYRHALRAPGHGSTKR